MRIFVNFLLIVRVFAVSRDVYKRQQVNAFTDYAMTGYYFSCTEHFDDCLRLLLRMVMTPDFPRAAMASEREVIADEDVYKRQGMNIPNAFPYEGKVARRSRDG